MTPERYQRVKELFHSAMECAENERPAFLAEACRGDAALRAKVEALIAAHERPGTFMDAPAYELAAGLLAGEPDLSLVGQRIGHYQIIKLLGSGGMGDVYLARDTRLGRKVALKLLPDSLTDDENRVRRFKQEARAASALNHPNILTIYEIEQTGGRYFIATEFIEGVTLRQRMKSNQIKLSEALGIAVQVANALSKAHQIGIVHRDIKPENIMLDDEGRVKVLDFGLAKYTSFMNVDEAGVSTMENAHTVPGLVMGTTAYMSPEQARGLEVDARTDLWSLGCVLYEILAGRAPFNAPTRSDVLAAILEREPEPLAGQNFKAPAELQRIIRKLLQKRLEERYQTSKDLALDLENLRREMDALSHAERATPINESLAATASPAALPAATTTGELTVAASGQPAATPLGRNNRALVLMLIACLLLATAGLVGWRMWHSSRAEATGPAVAAPVAEPGRRLVYWMLVQKYRDGKPYQAPFRLGGEINFEKDYRVRLNLSSQQRGYLYILNEGPAQASQSPPYIILFPSPTANDGLSLLAAGQQVQIPERSWFRFDEEEGTEKIWVVWSANSVPALEAVKGFANPRDRGIIARPELNEAVREFLQARSDQRQITERDEEQRAIAITSNGDILVHLLRLEHH